MVFPVVGGDGKPTGYEITNSLRFSGGTPYLSRQFSGANTSRKKFTLSCWLKRSKLGETAIIGASTTSNFYDNITFSSTDQLDINNVASGSDAISFKTTMKFRDQSAWYHIVFGIDTAQSSGSDGVKIYINGVLQTSLATSNYTQDATFEIGRDGSTTSIGRRQRDGDYYDIGYLSDFYYIDGQQLDASYFGETNDNGVWIPKQYDGTYGNNGFLLEFKQTGTSQNSSGMGADTSGNDEHFASNNLSSDHVTTDTPTNNFATLRFHGFPSSKGTITEGNLIWDTTGDGSDSARDLRQQAISNIGVTSGKWYAEFKHTEDANGLFIGVSNMSNKIHTDEIESYAYILSDNGNLYRREYTGQGESNSAHGGGSNSLNDIYMIALDMDNTNVYFGKNGQWASGSGAWNQSNPTSAYSISTNFINTDSHGVIVFNCSGAGSSETPAVEANFGNPTFSISSGNADANGYGNFEYAVPSGYYSLCTKNLAEYG